MARRSLTVGLMLLVMSLGACDGTVAPSFSAAATTTPFPTQRTSTFPLDVAAWYAGLVLHFDSATAVVDDGGGSVRIDLRLENPGLELAGLEAPVAIESGGVSVDPVGVSTLPDVPPGATIGASLQFNVDGRFGLAEAVVRIGRPAEHVVVIPLVGGSQEQVTLEPAVFPLAGSGLAGSLAVSLTRAELRADLPDWGIELARETLALTVTYAARYRGVFSGGFAFTGGNIALRLPDGTLVSARPDGHSQSVVVLAPGVLVPDLTARFDVPAPGSGAYALVVSDGSSTRDIAFTIDGAVPGG